jgi:hypothetical protein
MVNLYITLHVYSSCVHIIFTPRRRATVLLYKRKLFISRSCPILVLTTVLGLPRRADVKNGVNNYQGPTTSRENAIQKYLIFPQNVFLIFSVIMTLICIGT